MALSVTAGIFAIRRLLARLAGALFGHVLRHMMLASRGHDIVAETPARLIHARAVVAGWIVSVYDKPDTNSLIVAGASGDPEPVAPGRIDTLRPVYTGLFGSTAEVKAALSRLGATPPAPPPDAHD